MFSNVIYGGKFVESFYQIGIKEFGVYRLLEEVSMYLSHRFWKLNFCFLVDEMIDLVVNDFVEESPIRQDVFAEIDDVVYSSSFDKSCNVFLHSLVYDLKFVLRIHVLYLLKVLCYLVYFWWSGF